MSRSTRHFGLSTTLGTIVGALAVLIVVACTISGLDAWRGYRTAQRVAEVNATTDLLLKGLENLQLERGLTNTALQAPAAVTASSRDAIEKRRGEGDPLLAQGLDNLSSTDIPDGARLIADLRTSYERVKQMRRDADTALQSAKEQRNGDLLKNWYPGISDLLAKIQALWTSASREVSKEDAIVGQLTIIKQSAFLMREYAGRERALYAANLSAGRAISPEQQRDIAGWRGQVQAYWQSIRDLSAGTSPALASAVDAVQNGYMGTFQAQIDALHKAGLAGNSYPMTAQEWTALSNLALETIVKIKDAAVEVTTSHADDVAAAAKGRLALILVLSVLGIAVGVTSIWVVSNRVVRPLTAMAGTMRRLADGDKSIDIPARDRSDEVGAMAQAVEVFRDNALKADELANSQLAEQEKKEQRRVAMETLTQDFDRKATGVLDSVANSITEMRATAEKMSAVAEENTQKASAVTSGAQQTSSNVQTVAAATEELSASVAEIGRQVSQSSVITSRAVTEADQTNMEIQSLAAMAQKIGDIVKLISDIAGQTNLLALNATIEAARAGDAGRGFAVVASEVKNLATQTAKATEDIAAQISAIQDATDRSVAAIGNISTTIGEINQISSTIAAAVEEQGAATQEIARNVQEAATGTQQVSGHVGGVTQAAMETDAAARMVLVAAGDLSTQSRHLREQVDGFLNQVRAA